MKKGDSKKERSSQTIDQNGVDRTLIRWMLSLTPVERIQYCENATAAQELLRRGNLALK